MWDGQTVAILASGESMSCEVVDQLRVAAGIRVIAINNNYRLAPWADLLYASDARWWDVHHKKVDGAGFKGTKVCCEQVVQVAHPDVLWLRTSGERGFDSNPEFIRTGSNSGFQALHLAAHTGAKRILLCGYNMRGKHWHPEHEKPLKQTNPDYYPIWITRLAELRTQLPQGVEVFNCTPNSALKCFPFKTLEQALIEYTQERTCALSA